MPKFASPKTVTYLAFLILVASLAVTSPIASDTRKSNLKIREDGSGIGGKGDITPNHSNNTNTSFAGATESVSPQKSAVPLSPGDRIQDGAVKKPIDLPGNISVTHPKENNATNGNTAPTKTNPVDRAGGVGPSFFYTAGRMFVQCSDSAQILARLRTLFNDPDNTHGLTWSLMIPGVTVVDFSDVIFRPDRLESSYMGAVQREQQRCRRCSCDSESGDLVINTQQYSSTSTQSGASVRCDTQHKVDVCIDVYGTYKFSYMQENQGRESKGQERIKKEGTLK
ncbi:hypothetical protein TWF481_003592 [Arthrobotrys musiformis]|uniref:Uncharacterized protein n=1 Tax=Arthrobotrys musiformis TaxID=47236 RepID=A0AAV9WJ14_9PEZI